MNLQQHVLAFGFTNLAMLGWLAAAAAPLLIHLWSRHRFREAPWAAMQFLLAAMRKNARRLQLQQWLLLALRTMLIVLVVLAVAQPFGERLVAGSAAGPTHKLIVLDGSYSMAYRPNDSTNFERAKKLAAELVRQSSAGDTCSVILMAKPPKKLVRRKQGNLSAIASQIESLEQTHTGADLNATLALVEADFASDESPFTSSTRREAYFFTDLQRSTWRSAASSNPDGDALTSSPDKNQKSTTLQDITSRLAKQATLHIIDLGQPNASNVAITHFSAAEPFIIASRDVPFEITLREFGGKPRPQHAVELLVDDVPVAEQTVDIPADGEATIRLTHRFDSVGQHKLTARAARDELEIDNMRFLIVPVREKVRVLCVEGRDGAARYVAEALSARSGPDSPIAPTIVSESALADIDVTKFDSVFMCNVAQLTDGEAARLTNYAANGGGVVFFLGNQVIPESYNKFSGAGGRRRRAASPQNQGVLIPARIGDVAVNTQSGIDPLDYNHPIVAPFRGQDRAGLLTTPVSRYYKLELPPDRGDSQVAASLHGDPFMVTSTLGRGRTVLVATDASLSSVDRATEDPWTLWPTWPSFLPMMRELLAYALSGQHDDWQQVVGTALGGPLPAALPTSAQSELQMLRPDGRTGAVSIDASADESQWSYSGTLVSGIYTLAGLPDDASGQFALNVETSESDLAKANASELPPEFVVGNSSQNEADLQPASIVSQAAWHGPLLWAALALMLLESLFAWQFGRGGT